MARNRLTRRSAPRRPAALAAIATLLMLSGCGGPIGLVTDVGTATVKTGARVAGATVRGGTKIATAPARALFAPGMGVSDPVAQLSRDERMCRRELKRLKVSFSEAAPIGGAGGCGIVHPVEVRSLSKRIALKPAATLNCRAALAAARWAHDELAPAARRRYASNVRELRHMSAYSCRRIRGSGRLSEHGKGNALDVGSFVLGNGRTIDVAKPGFFSFREKSFLKAVREGACRHFTTVLGPGSDRDHADHFHFDLKARRGGRRYCDL